MNKIFMLLFSQLLSVTLQNVTPAVLKELTEIIRTFQARCLATPNPWDDAFAAVLGSLLSVFCLDCSSEK